MSFKQEVEEAVRAALAPLERKIEALSGELQQRLAAASPPADPDESLGLPRAAKIVGKCTATLARAIKVGKLKASRPSGAREWVILRRDLNDWRAGKKGKVDVAAKIEEARRRLAKAS